MWFIPLLVIGAIVVTAANRARREAPRRLPSGPGPIAVLGEFVRIGQTPPSTVILCAIAEAETIGRNDVVSDIIRLFVAPVVYRHQMSKARGACAPVAREGTSPGPSVTPPASALSGPPFQAAVPIPQAMSPQATTRLATDEEIRAMLNADPQKFIEMAARGGVPVIEVPVETVRQAQAQAQAAASAPSGTPLPSPSAQPTEIPPEMVAEMQEAAGLHEAADQTRALAPGSPLVGVADGAWREFVVRLERESPLFSSSRHVGQYRQRRERLAELGVDPNALRGSAQAQRAALDADLVDAHQHAAEGGLTEHIDRPIVVPGHEGSESITLSGLLGVIQCAGLEGAVGWLEHPSDRKRYPHTTQAFLRTNGVF